MSIDKLARLEHLLNYKFNNREYLLTALTHPSFIGRNNYERFEFLGDSILNFTIAEKSFFDYKKFDEGKLTRIRSQIVREETLAKVAQERLDLGNFIFLGPGEIKSGGFRKPSILSDSLEAIIAAVYLDSNNIDIVKDLIIYLFNDEIRNPNGVIKKDSKTELQEFLQAKKIPLPEYVIIDTLGKPHQQTLTVACVIPSLSLRVESQGSVRRHIEKELARLMLLKVKEKINVKLNV